MELQLICHGMMLFWYRRPRYSEFDDGYTILIPRKSNNHEHKVRLGVGPGAHETVLGYDDEDPKETRRGAIAFGVADSDKPRGPKPKSFNLMFLHKDFQAFADSRGVAFAIDIPYPHREEPVRVATYGPEQPPYERPDGSAAHAFKISPTRLVATTVFTYRIADPSKGLTLHIGSDMRKILDHEEMHGTVKLHLYSQQRHHIAGDIGMLNQMLQWNRKGSSGVSSQLNLKPNDCRKALLDLPDFPIPQGLTFRDCLHLTELHNLDHPIDDKDKDMPRIMAIDPAECGQGGGC
jgi:hypothetical protein